MSLLLPQTRAGEVLYAQTVDIHGDRYVDVRVAIDGEAAGRGHRASAACRPPIAPRTSARASASRCAS